MCQLLSWILIKIDLLSWRYRGMIFIRKDYLNFELWTLIDDINKRGGICGKLDREGFTWILYVSTPHKLNFELLIKSLEKVKRNALKLSRIFLFWNTVFIRSIPVVYVLYNILCILYKQNLFGTCHYTFKLTLLMTSVWFCCCTGNTLPDLPLDF